MRDANIGSIMGIGFPVWTGGILQFINQTGFDAFIERAEYLFETCGERFRVPNLLKDMAKDNLVFKDNWSPATLICKPIAQYFKNKKGNEYD